MADVVNSASPRAVADQSTADLVHRATEQVSRLIRDELALARTELAEKGRHAGLGIGLFGGGGVFALLGVGTALQDARGELPRAGAGLLGPGDDPRRRPLQVLLVRLGPVARLGGEAALPVGSRVGRNPAPGVKDLDRAGGEAHVHLLTDQPVRNAIAVVFDGDVIVDVHARL